MATGGREGPHGGWSVGLSRPLGGGLLAWPLSLADRWPSVSWGYSQCDCQSGQAALHSVTEERVFCLGDRAFPRGFGVTAHVAPSVGVSDLQSRPNILPAVWPVTPGSGDFLSSSTVTMSPGLHQRELFLPVLEAENPSARSVLGERSSWPAGGAVSSPSRGSSGFLFLPSLSPTLMTSSNPDPRRKAPPPVPPHGGLGLQHSTFGGTQCSV